MKASIKDGLCSEKYSYSTIVVIFVVLLSLVISCTNRSKNQQEKVTSDSFSLAFGSCQHQDKNIPLLRKALEYDPDVFIFLGDNIYGDSYNMDTLWSKYQKLGAKPEFQALKENTEVLAIWDDHDYGSNDAGRHYLKKDESKKLFLDFWDVPTSSNRHRRQGIFEVVEKTVADKTIQIILLDTRYFRDRLVQTQPSDSAHGYKNDYKPNPSPDSTLLGSRQWTWLEEVLKHPADLRIVCSSIQFSHEYNGWESWTNVPHEQKRFVDLISQTRADGIVFISGDVHWGEISKFEPQGSPYPLYDVTSSGLTETWHNTEPNANRIGPVIPQNNFGLIKYDVHTDELLLQLVDSSGPVVIHRLALSEISIPHKK